MKTSSKFFIALITLIYTSIFMYTNLHAEYSLFKENIMRQKKGKDFKESYQSIYSDELSSKFLEYSLESIEDHLAPELREATKELYKTSVNKIIADLSYLFNTYRESDFVIFLRKCINEKAPYLEVEEQCVPRMLWDYGYSKYTQCAAERVKQATNYCLDSSDRPLYDKNYIFDINENFSDYTYNSINMYKENNYQNQIKSLYNMATDKIISDLEYMSDLDRSEPILKNLIECINTNSKYEKISYQCVPNLLWNAGFKAFSECAASDIKTSIDYCLGLAGELEN